jgi:hypothetical protein
MKKSQQNPDFFNPRNPHRSLSFLEHYYTQYQRYVDIYSWIEGYTGRPKHSRRVYLISHYNGRKAYMPLIYKFYFEGRYVYQALNMSFKDFADYLIRGIPSSLYYAVKPLPRRSKWYYRGVQYVLDRDNGFRQKIKYQRKKTHCKKERSEEYVAKQEWRKKKGIDKDNQKANYRRTGIPKWMKRHCHKMHRQMQRECIYRENYDKLPTCKTDKSIFDPWMYY